MASIFSKQKKEKTTSLHLKIDLHNHILPGIDDGAQDIDESLEMLEAYQAQGFTKIIATPHVNSERFLNSTDDILEATEIFLEAKEKENIPIQIAVSAEYYADKHLFYLLEKNDVLSIANKYLLCEFSFYFPPIDAKLIANEIKNAGYIPILAHPERYEYWFNDIKAFEKLKEYGFLFQSNLPSASGLLGPIPKHNFYLLANKGWIDFLGTDAHNAFSIYLMQNIIELNIGTKNIT